MAPTPLRTLFKHKLKPWRSSKQFSLTKEEQEELELIKPSSSNGDDRPPPPKKNTVGNMQRPQIFRGGMTSQGIKRFGQKGAIFIYLDDMYHTLLNMPRYRFLGSFFVSYLLLYLLFAFVYMTMPAECICSEECGVVTFSHAFWFSVQTASTIGYSTVLVPSPDCDGINFFVTFHLMVRFDMLGSVDDWTCGFGK
ncbi:hypothetical protein DUNSADRAFT_11881 [Dunaliella salina]|uniref:Potassium channel domain-containing protein n=1 Tax=Dunaliella salina TaxID=3046 RepID=A0ABQ7H495_DUNSA|nr:hypothetical protein DUNSADRAFT_11881 [Dunaliella salina]|eukprot:KAF5841674.1 hypothetical protein DUNSADRAFT_11881 [Dunaliella salina]